jgi:tetratricopeptide (TPR) repeat protein
MAYGERGDTEKGKSWFHATERWHRMYNIDNQLLRQYHQEAANVLDIAVAPLTKIKGTAIEWTSGLELFIAADPDASWPHAMLGQTFIGEGDWSHAAEHLLVAVRGPRVVVDSAVNSGYSLALAYLRLGDEAGYRDACATLLQATRAAEGNTWACNRAAWTCVLGPHALQDFTIPLRFAGEAVEESPQNPGYLLTLGALRYRTGVYEVAAQTLKRSIAAFADDGSGSSSVLYPKLFLMMTYWRLGRNDEARELHAECTAAINEQIASATTYWNRRLTLELISREAEALIDQNNAEQTESEPSPTDNQE